MIFREIVFGSNEYKSECSLREEVLWNPLGLSLRNEDRSQESGQRHFGLFAPGGELMACAVAAPLSSAEVKVRQVAVYPIHQGKGLGSRLMNAVEENLRTQGFIRLVLHSQASAVRFYEKLGYSVIGEEFLEANIPHRKMEKNVA